MKKVLFTIVLLLIPIFFFLLIPKMASAGEVKDDGDDSNAGMRKVILKKNMVNGVNILTQDMMPLITGGNTIYVIQYSFVLGENITVPKNCVLEFDGGLITAGNRDGKHTLTGQNTAVQAGLVKIFGANVNLAGSWKVEYGHPEWFGAKGDGNCDDTDAFYSALSNFGSIFLSGQYCIDFKDIKLNNKAIVGKWRTKSGIVQRNKNVPFALVGTYNLLNGFTIKAYNNTKVTDVLHFGFSNGIYNKFSFTDIKNVVISGAKNASDDAKIIPLHFNMKNGGNADCIIENVRIYHCYMGIWYEFHEDSSPFGWITQSSMKDVTVYNPSYYGFKWDALSMYNRSPMWCYANYFENISIDIIRNGAVGFYIGQGMGMLVNPTVFNDIPANQSSAVGYSAEFAPIGSPVRPKMVTNIIGGSFEGQIKNMDYAYMNNIHNLKVSLRDNRGSKDRYISLDSENITDAYDLNIFGKDVLNTFSVKNAKLSIGSDDFGEYLMVTRIDPSMVSYFSGGMTKQELREGGIKNGLYTLHTVAQSNLGSSGTGFFFKNPGYRYTIDGQSGENIVLGKNGDIIGNNVFINVTDRIREKMDFGYYFPANSKHKWVKIYSIRLMSGIVGKYLMEKPESHNKETINISKTFNVGNGALCCSASFSTIKEVTNYSCPINFQCEGRIPPGTVGKMITIGKLQCYNVPNKIVFQVYDTEKGNIVGMCFIENDGTIKFRYATKIDRITNVFGSA